MNPTEKKELLLKIKEAGLVGRGGASFPVHLKWQRILETEAAEKYVVCNVSEGEPGVKKDFYLLKHEAEKVLAGLRIALDFLDSRTAYFNFNAEYWQRLESQLEPYLAKLRSAGYQLNIFQKEPSYIGGETGALLNAIEGKRTEPRLKPPSPSLTGINGRPVLLHNVETLYDVYLVEKGLYQGNRCYTLGGQVKSPGVYQLPASLSVAEVLRQTDNYPDFAFFAQVGGGASGPVWSQDQLETNPAIGTGSIEVYPLTTPAKQILDKWFKFYRAESCGKCAPCRQGTYELERLLTGLSSDQEIPWAKIEPIIETLKKTAFCELGRSLAVPVKTYWQNVWRKNNQGPKG